MYEKIKEISKVDKQLLDKIEHILGSELSNEEYDKFYNYFNEIRKPNILIDIKDVESIKDYITNLQKENELHGKILKDANDVLNIQAQKGNYNYDSYMLGLYNGMEMIVSLFEQREPKLKSGKDIKFLHETDYKQRNEKAVEYIKQHCDRPGRLLLPKIDFNYNDLLNILEDGDE